MRHRLLFLVLVSCFLTQVAHAQFGAIKGALKKAEDTKKQFEITDADEMALGEQISAKIRVRYGVAQNSEVHKYVALVGNALAKKSSRSSLAWQFIVLDTDGVNALAAPGGYIHITRGALALMNSEAELAGVLAHEIAHVTRKHTLKAIQQGKAVEFGGNAAGLKDNPQLMQRLVEEGYKIVFAGFGRSDELESDMDGLALATQTGYAPLGLTQFLRAIQLRNKESDQKQGLFASHPEMNERLQKLDAAVAQNKSGASATLEARYVLSVKYKAVPIAALAVIEDPAAAQPAAAAAAPPPEEKKEEKKQSRFSIGGLKNAVAGGSDSKQSAAVTGSGGSRGVDRERAAKGGPNPNKVAVTITDAEIATFIKDGKLTS